MRRGLLATALIALAISGVASAHGANRERVFSLTLGVDKPHANCGTTSWYATEGACSGPAAFHVEGYAVPEGHAHLTWCGAADASCALPGGWTALPEYRHGRWIKICRATESASCADWLLGVAVKLTAVPPPELVYAFNVVTGRMEGKPVYNDSGVLDAIGHSRGPLALHVAVVTGTSPHRATFRLRGSIRF